MNKIAQMTAQERADVFAETAERKALAEAIIEKDFWVCWVLRQLFSIGGSPQKTDNEARLGTYGYLNQRHARR